MERELDYLLNVWCDCARGAVIVHSNLPALCLSGGHCQLSCLPVSSLNLWNYLG